MNKMLEIILETVSVAILVIFLLFILMSGNFNGNKGLMNGLADNPYQDINNDISDNGLVDSFSSQTPTNEMEFNITYTGGTLNVYNPETQVGVYDIRELYKISYDGADYIWNGNTWVDGNSNTREFRLYVSTIEDTKGNEIFSLKSLEDVSESELITDTVIFDEDNYELVVLSEGRYDIELTITDKETLRTISRKHRFPARIAE